jgi:hypothetical protein
VLEPAIGVESEIADTVPATTDVRVVTGADGLLWAVPAAETDEPVTTAPATRRSRLCA